LAIIHGDGGHYQAEHGLQKAAKDAQEKVIQMMTRSATAEPVAQPADSGCEVQDGYVAEITRHDRILLDGRYHSVARVRAALAANQPINLAAVREVIVWLRSGSMAITANAGIAADKLEAALPESKP
jgi:hypothetical protein